MPGLYLAFVRNEEDTCRVTNYSEAAVGGLRTPANFKKSRPAGIERGGLPTEPCDRSTIVRERGLSIPFLFSLFEKLADVSFVFCSHLARTTADRRATTGLVSTRARATTFIETIKYFQVQRIWYIHECRVGDMRGRLA